MAKMVEGDIVLDPKLHVEFDFATAGGHRALWEAIQMQKGFASYFAWCKMGKFRCPFQPMMLLNTACICIRKEVPAMV